MDNLNDFFGSAPFHVVLIAFVCVAIPIAAIVVAFFLSVIIVFGFYGIIALWLAGIAILTRYLWITK
jgi:hypothetical protein